jgi:hypothetical protein
MRENNNLSNRYFAYQRWRKPPMKDIEQELEEKQAIIDRLILETAGISKSPDWSIRHIKAESFSEIQGIQKSPYRDSGRFAPGHFQPIRWTLYYKGVKVFFWESRWNPVVLSGVDLVKLGIPFEQVSGKCLKLHLESSHASDPVREQVVASLVDPGCWAEGVPNKYYVLRVVLVGRYYDYHYRIDENYQPVFSHLEGSDPQDSHVGWGRD